MESLNPLQAVNATPTLSFIFIKTTPYDQLPFLVLLLFTLHCKVQRLHLLLCDLPFDDVKPTQGEGEAQDM